MEGPCLTIRSSRARFAASCKCYTFSPAQGRKSARLNSGVSSFQKKISVKEHQSKVLSRTRRAWLGFWLSPQTPCRLERRHSVSGFGISQRAIVSTRLGSSTGSRLKATAGNELTIRSSRARFAASCKFLQVSLAQGRKAVRLNSGVRPVQKQMPVNKRQAKLACSPLDLPRLLILATNSVPARAPALRFWVQHFKARSSGILGPVVRKRRFSALHSAQVIGVG